MNLKFPLLSLCINATLLSVLVGRSYGGVTNLCEPGQFYDRSKQEYRPCNECKPEIRDCFSCCQPETENQDEGSKTRNVTTLNTPPQGKDAPGTKKEKPLPSKAETSLPNILVVSIVSVFLFASLLVLLFILIRAFLGRHVQANEGSSDTQRSDVVMEIVMGEVKDDTNNCDITASDGGVRT